ncbi:unnamed protein product [Bursaphelenchus okinawaensis]|uniref:Ribonuclease H1 n=1 Tax=Bursaphelenchus okinawaensis TaxID=465554 RepID=A0A811KDQ4_9BILA|nr:unnamed protein product [Bursaphelenchus okinawaensis]CAG9098633.1 unnamed protein product [Bursaphelenchus okinawaensis]
MRGSLSGFVNRLELYWVKRSLHRHIFARFEVLKMPFYAVAKGRNVGIYNSWDDCKAQVNGFSGPVFKKFNSQAEAQDFVDSKRSAGSNGYQRQYQGNSGIEVESNKTPSNSITNSKPSTAGYNTNRRALFGSANVSRGPFTIPSNRMTVQEPSSSQSTENDRGPVRKRFHHPNGDYGGAKKAKFSNPHSDAPTVWTDGACRGNGKKRARAGWGVFWGDGHQDNSCGPLIGQEQTNNRAEYTAVIEALKTAQRKGYDKLNINTDSNLLVKSMTEWMPKWRRNGWKTAAGAPVKNKDLLVAINELCQKVNTHFQHVDGHCGIHGNEMADRLACRGADERQDL